MSHNIQNKVYFTYFNSKQLIVYKICAEASFFVVVKEHYSLIEFFYLKFLNVKFFFFSFRYILDLVIILYLVYIYIYFVYYYSRILNKKTKREYISY